MEVSFPPELVEQFSDNEWRKFRKKVCEDLGIAETDLIEREREGEDDHTEARTH